jgi:hypothetical protein
LSSVEEHLAVAYACDTEGREQDAIVHYDAAWKLGVPAAERRSFLVGYGSTLRNVGRLEESCALLSCAVAEDPGYAPFKVFLALALHSSGEHERAMATMLAAILDVSNGGTLDGFSRAIGEYQRELAG